MARDILRKSLIASRGSERSDRTQHDIIDIRGFSLKRIPNPTL